MGKLLSVAVSDDNTIKVWHLMTGELLRTIEGHTGYLIQSPSAQMEKLLSVAVTIPSTSGIL
jgi:WD40 repeat protein